MKKSLGQQFIKNKTANEKIIAALDLKPEKTVIEIGPGEGALTFPLLKKGARVIAIEKDLLLVERLKVGGKRKNLEIINGDILKILPELPLTLHPKLSNYKLVGNIPYYITGKLLRILSELENKPSLTILMIQKEVAERLTAKPPKMNLLAAAVQFWAEPKIIFTLKPTDFNPLPKVDSAAIKLTPLPSALEANPENYYKFL